MTAATAAEQRAVAAARIERLEARAYTIPTDRSESDGTLKWDSTTIVVAHIEAGGKRGFGYSYTSAGAVSVIRSELSKAVAATLCEVHFLPLSSHTAPAVSLHVCCAADRVRHLEYFHDHVRIENILLFSPCLRASVVNFVFGEVYA